MGCFFDEPRVGAIVTLQVDTENPDSGVLNNWWVGRRVRITSITDDLRWPYNVVAVDNTNRENVVARNEIVQGSIGNPNPEESV